MVIQWYGSFLVNQRVHRLFHAALDAVVGAHAALFFDHLALFDHVGGIELQVAHAVRLDVQDQRQILRRRSDVVKREVVAGPGVVVRADVAQSGRKRINVVPGRALEHHVLEEVRQARLPRHLVLRADLVPRLHVDHRRRTIGQQQHGQPVGQLILLDRNLDGARQVDAQRPRRAAASPAASGQRSQTSGNLRERRIVPSAVVAVKAL